MARRSARRPPGLAGGAALVPAFPGDGLETLTTALRLARTAEDVMSALVLEAEQAFGAASAVAYMVGGATLELAAAMGRAEDAHEWLRVAPLSAQMPVARAVREGRPGWYESRAALAEVFPGWAERVPHFERFGALAALPLRAGDVALGVIGFAFDAERGFSPEERAALEAVAAEGAAALARIGVLDGQGAAQAAPVPEGRPAPPRGAAGSGRAGGRPPSRSRARRARARCSRCGAPKRLPVG